MLRRNRPLPLAFVLFWSALAAAHEPGEDDKPTAVLTAPVLLQRIEPVYPEAARQNGVGGTVSLELTVGVDGLVTTVKITRSAGFGFDAAAAEAARRFRFRPATDHGKPIAAIVNFDQSFVIRPHIIAETEATPPTPPAEALPPEPSSKYQSTVEARGPTSAASSTTVRNEDFDLRPRSSPNDLLRVVPGLLAVQHQGGGKADQLFLRGFDADHGTDVGVFVDGVPINMPSHAHGQGFADLHWIIPEAIERIDVVKGPYDARYGDFSTAGAVNLVTRDRFPESSVQLTLGSFPTQEGRLLATERFVGIVAPRFTSGGAEKLHPWVAFELAHDDGPFVNSEQLLRYNLFGKLTYDLSPTTSIGMFVQAYGSSWIGSGQIPARLVGHNGFTPFSALDPSEGGISERQMVTAFLHHKDGDSELNATVYLTRYKLSLWNDFTFYLEDPVNASEIEQDDARLFTGARIDWHFHRHWNRISFRTSVGAEMRYDGIHVDRWDAESCGVNGTPAGGCPGGDFRKRLGRHVDSSNFAFNGNNGDVNQLNLAAWAEEDVVFNRYFRLLAALRADYFGFAVSDLGETYGVGKPNTSGTAQKALFSPKATAVITPLPGMLDLYLNYGSGFHTNQAQVALLDGQQRTDTSGHAFTIRAVPQIYAGELGARLHLWNRLDLAGAFWVSYLQNETVFDADHSSFAPSVPTRRIGVDAELRLKILSWLLADFDLAQASSTAVPDHGNGGAVALAPRLYMTGGLTVRLPVGFRASLRVRYVGERPAFDETSPEYQYCTHPLPSGMPNPDCSAANVTAQAYVLVDAFVGYRYRFLEASLAVQNLFNTQWREAQFGNRSCSRDETYNPQNPNYNGSGNLLADGSFANRCGIAHQMDKGGDTRSGVTDVHYTPGVPINLQLTLKAYF